MPVKCKGCQHSITNGHPEGKGGCWMQPDKHQMLIDADRECMVHAKKGVKLPPTKLVLVSGGVKEDPVSKVRQWKQK
jgi:hypothetical protein